LLRDGRTRRCSARPVPRRRCRRRRSRANGAKRGCLGGSWGLGVLLRLIGGAFYRPKRRGTRRPEARRLGGPGYVWSSLRSRRSRSRAGRVLARPRGAVGLLWRGQGGRRRAGKKITGRGPWAHFSSFLPFSWLGSGLGKLGSTVVSPRRIATALERTRTVINTVIRIRFDCFCQCSTKCPQEFEIQIFEIF
jgi:hypothetical protein